MTSAHGQRREVKQMGMINLKPCPFCGSENVVLYSYSEGGVCVKCLECYCQTGVFSDTNISEAKKDSAAERVLRAWDRRVAPDEKTIEEKCMEHYRQGRKDEADLREGRLMQCFNPD